jgi:hypothetical protein
VSLDELTTKYGATYFHEAFSHFVTLSRYPSISAVQLEHAIWGIEMPMQNFWVWHRIKYLSTDPFTGSTSTTDSIHVNPKAQRFDTALIRTNAEWNGIHRLSSFFFMHQLLTSALHRFSRWAHPCRVLNATQHPPVGVS